VDQTCHSKKNRVIGIGIGKQVMMSISPMITQQLYSVQRLD